jgi:membrane fusion protein (multidrug efflux system)
MAFHPLHINMKSLHYNIFSSLFALVILCNACGSETTESTSTTTTATPEIATFKLAKQPMETSLHLPGELVASQQVDLYAKVSSFVRTVNVDIGSEVKKGQLLLTLEAPEMASQIAAAESRLKAQEAILTASKSNYNRLYETSKTPGTISKNDLDQAMARRNSDEAQYEAAKAAIREVGAIRDYLDIRAPFNGIISARNVDPGAYVGPSGKGSELPLFTLQDERNLQLIISIPEMYTGYLKPGSEVSFTVKSKPEQVFHTKVTRMAGALDTRLRSERIEMDIKNDHMNLLPGMITEVTVPLPARTSAFVIPKKALLDSDEGIFVIRVVNNKIQKVPVKKGRITEDKVEVFGELQENDNLVSEASEELRDGSPFKN